MPHSAEVEKIKKEFQELSKETNEFTVNNYRIKCHQIMEPFSYESVAAIFSTKTALKAKELFKLQEEVEELENKDSAILKR
jgi:hypothetical protein